MTDAPSAPARTASLDTTKPNIARVYDALLGGKDNFAADRAVAQQMIDVIAPYGDATEGPRQIRAALMRAVRYLATEAGIGQFVDLGSGLPTQQNVHEVVHRHRPGAPVVYVDSDPMVVRGDRGDIPAELRQPFPHGRRDRGVLRRLADPSAGTGVPAVPASRAHRS